MRSLTCLRDALALIRLHFTYVPVLILFPPLPVYDTNDSSIVHAGNQFERVCCSAAPQHFSINLASLTLASSVTVQCQEPRTAISRSMIETREAAPLNIAMSGNLNNHSSKSSHDHSSTSAGPDSVITTASSGPPTSLPTTSPPTSPAQKKSKTKLGLVGFLTLKEPSTAALEDFVKNERKKSLPDDSPTDQRPQSAYQRLPDFVPKVNSRWDGMPLSASSQGRDSWKKPTSSSSTRPLSSKRSTLGSSSASSQSSKCPNSPRMSTPPRSPNESQKSRSKEHPNIPSKPDRVQFKEAANSISYLPSLSSVPTLSAKSDVAPPVLPQKEKAKVQPYGIESTQALQDTHKMEEAKTEHYEDPSELQTPRPANSTPIRGEELNPNWPLPADQTEADSGTDYMEDLSPPLPPKSRLRALSTPQQGHHATVGDSTKNPPRFGNAFAPTERKLNTSPTQSPSSRAHRNFTRPFPTDTDMSGITVGLALDSAPPAQSQNSQFLQPLTPSLSRNVIKEPSLPSIPETDRASVNLISVAPEPNPEATVAGNEVVNHADFENQSTVDSSRASISSEMSAQWYQSPRERLGLGGFIKHHTKDTPWPLQQEEDANYVIGSDGRGSMEDKEGRGWRRGSFMGFMKK